MRSLLHLKTPPIRLLLSLPLALFVSIAIGADELPPCCPGPACPNGTVRMIVPFLAGAPTDTVARILAQGMQNQTGQQFVVDNRSGAGGNIAFEIAAKADWRNTLLIANTQLTINPSVYKNFSLDPTKDLRPIALLATMPMVLVVNPSIPAKSVKEFIAVARARPGGVSIASSGAGGVSDLAGYLFTSATGASFTHIPYKGEGTAASSVISGEVNAGVSTLAAAFPQIRAGRLRVLAVLSNQRAQALPDVPTVKDAIGLDVSADTWQGVFAGKDTPPECQKSMNRKFVSIMRSPESLKSLESMGFAVPDYSYEAFNAFVKTESTKWARVVKAADIRAE